jgi:hypothetical protein
MITKTLTPANSTATPTLASKETAPTLTSPPLRGNHHGTKTTGLVILLLLPPFFKAAVKPHRPKIF